MKNNIQIEKINVIRAFRVYARLGLLRFKGDPFEFCAYVKRLCGNRSTALDMFAVYDTLRVLRAMGENEAIEAVSEIYFIFFGSNPNRNEISERVLRFSRSHYCDERTVYRKLKMIKDLYGALRYEIKNKNLEKF